MASEPQEPSQFPFELRGVWEQPDPHELAVLANQLAVQVAQGNVLLTFGQLIGPTVSGTPEQQRERLTQLGSTPIRPVSQLAVPVPAFREMVGALQQTLAALDNAEQRSTEGTE